MKRAVSYLVFLSIALALAVLLGSCSGYRYYNRYPKPRKCGGCPSFSHRMEQTFFT